jgi:hypothetical protein
MAGRKPAAGLTRCSCANVSPLDPLSPAPAPSTPPSHAAPSPSNPSPSNPSPSSSPPAPASTSEAVKRPAPSDSSPSPACTSEAVKRPAPSPTDPSPTPTWPSPSPACTSEAVKRPAPSPTGPSPTGSSPSPTAPSPSPLHLLNSSGSLCSAGEIVDRQGRCASDHSETQDCCRRQGGLCTEHLRCSQFSPIAAPVFPDSLLPIFELFEQLPRRNNPPRNCRVSDPHVTKCH